MGQRLGTRLSTALKLLGDARVLADIGCDHGQLACAFVSANEARRCIAIDISAPSLEKARVLAEAQGLSRRVETRLGSGFEPLSVGEADACAVLGMGGTLMCELLDGCETDFRGAERIVFQPMRAPEDIRAWLWRHDCRILDDRMIEDGGRIYQIFAAAKPHSGRNELPTDWPTGYFGAGSVAFERREPLMKRWIDERLSRDEARLQTAGNAPRAEKLRCDAAALRWMQEHF